MMSLYCKYFLALIYLGFIKSKLITELPRTDPKLNSNNSMLDTNMQVYEFFYELDII